MKMGYGSALILGLTLISALLLGADPSSAAFTCKLQQSTCGALIEYSAPNATTLSAIKTLFGVKKFYNLLGANNLPISTQPNHTVAAEQKIVVPFTCLCANGTGVSNRAPIYNVTAGDSLDHIARDIFSELTTYQEIARVNGIPDPSLIQPGQKLWIPLPCSCDAAAGGGRVVHYGHVVEKGSSLDAIAARFGTTVNTLYDANGMNSSSLLLAGQILDVPRPACSSSIRNDSSDSSLLLPNGTYAYTANQCVKCKCDSANNLTLHCEPSQHNSSGWQVCPSMQCKNSSLIIGNTTSGSSSCGGQTCAYAGFNNSTIFTTLTNNTCPVNNAGSKIGLKITSWNFLFVTIHLLFLSLCISR